MKKAGKQKKKRGLSIATETSMVILASLLIFALAVGFAGQALLKRVLNADAESNCQGIAMIAAYCVDGDDFDEYLQSKGTSASAKVALERLQNICDDSGFNYLYLIKPNLKTGKVVNSLSVSGSNYDRKTYKVGQVTEITTDSYRDSYKAIMSGKSDYECEFRTDISDGHVTGMVPVRNSAGDVVGIMCAEAPYAVYEALFLVFVFFLGVAAILILLMNGFIASRLMKARVTRPVKLISSEANRFAASKTVDSTGIKKIMTRNNELGQLASSVDAMEREIVESIESIKKMTAEQERVDAELDIAAKIQEAALPHDFPAFPERAEFDLYASMDPAKEVGGDFYDFFLVDDDHLALVMADVSGKGVPAALYMMVSKVMISNYAAVITDPAQVLSAVNNRLSANNEASMFVTAWLGILEISTGTLRCCNAGHEYPMLRSGAGDFKALQDEHGLALGLMEDAPYAQYEVQLRAGDTIFVYTDGAPEARNGEGEFYGMERLAGALNSCPDGSAQSLVQCVKQDVGSFVGDAPQFDDLTVLALRYSKE